MATITVSDLPDKAKETLKRQAARSGQSLESYARGILQDAANQAELVPVDILDIAKQLFGNENGIDLELPARDSDRKPVAFD